MEIRRSYDRLISTMGFPILERWQLYIESGPRYSPFSGHPEAHVHTELCWRDSSPHRRAQERLHLMPVVQCTKGLEDRSLQWRHNWYDGLSNHQPHDCFRNRSFRRKSKGTSKLRVTGLCAGIHRWPVNSPHKGPVTRKMFPFDDVIMKYKQKY